MHSVIIIDITGEKLKTTDLNGKNSCITNVNALMESTLMKILQLKRMQGGGGGLKHEENGIFFFLLNKMDSVI